MRSSVAVGLAALVAACGEAPPPAGTGGAAAGAGGDAGGGGGSTGCINALPGPLRAVQLSGAYSDLGEWVYVRMSDGTVRSLWRDGAGAWKPGFPPQPAEIAPP